MKETIIRKAPEEYAMAYVEVLEIIKRMDQEIYNKIPQKIIEKFEIQKSEGYEFIYDDNKDLKEQKLMPKTKDILAVLFIDYLATEQEKSLISKKQQEFKERKEERLQEEFDSSQIFKNKEKDVSKQEMQITEYKKPLHIRIFKKIKNIFNKNKML